MRPASEGRAAEPEFVAPVGRPNTGAGCQRPRFEARLANTRSRAR